MQRELCHHINLISMIRGHWELTGKFWKFENGESFTVLPSEYHYSISKLKPYTQIKILAGTFTGPLVSLTQLPLSSCSTTHTPVCLHSGTQIIPCNDFLRAIQFCVIPLTTENGSKWFIPAPQQHISDTAAVRSARADACTSKGSSLLKAYICIYLYTFFREIKIQYFLRSYKNDEFS